MIKAKEARKEAEMVVVQAELEPIEVAVREAAANGGFETSVNFLVKDATRTELESKYGYSVELSTFSNPQITIIKW